MITIWNKLERVKNSTPVYLNKLGVKNKISKLNNTGQSIIEYIILTSLIGIISIVAVKNLGGVLQRRINLIKEEIVRIIPND